MHHAVAAVVVVGAVGFADYVTGRELRISILYLLPVAYATWMVGPRTGLAVCVLSAVTWFLADFAWAPTYEHVIIPYYNAAVQLGFYTAVSLSMSALRTTMRHQDQLVSKRTSELAEYRDRLRDLASEMGLAEERERRRIATGIHDEISQSLAFAKMRLDDLGTWPLDADALETVEEVSHSLAQILGYTRDLTFDISPPVLYQLGFDAALEWLAERMSSRHGYEVLVQAEKTPRPIVEDVQVTLFHSVRELLNNAAKHSQATKVRIDVGRVGEHIEVVVSDNGVGFDPSKPRPRSGGGFGLFDISERLMHLGGQLEIHSSPGHGSSFTLTAPLAE